MEQKPFLYGLHIGEHGFEPETILRELKENCLDRGMNFVTLRICKIDSVAPEQLLSWARYMAENEIYFFFLYSIDITPAGGVKCQFTPELVQQLKEVGGKYFLGDLLGELGSLFCSKFEGYYHDQHPHMPPQGVADMQEAKENYIKAVDRYMEQERRLGMDKIGVGVVEATALSNYNIEAGARIPLVELMGSDPEIDIAATRGAARAYRSPFWGTYVAHEWYAGHYHEDVLKRKRLELEYKYAYLAGTQLLCHESGDELITAYGRRLERDSLVSTECRRFIDEFGAYIKQDARPTHVKPIVKMAFMRGNLDAWDGRGRDSVCLGGLVWAQMQGEEWGYGAPEWSWNILEEMGRKRRWWEFDSYACHGRDLSSLPPYGSYDVIPADTPVEVLTQYDTVICCGWNTMTEDQLERLERFVEQGGTLLMGAAHLNTTAKRGGEEVSFVRGGDLSRLFGCRLTGKVFKSALGSKFFGESLVKDVMYPSATYVYGDPMYSSGYARYAEVELCGAQVPATLEDSFEHLHQPGHPSLLEHRLGKGVAMLMTAVDYPGHGAVYPLYRFLVRELMRAGVANAPVRVCAPASVRYSVFENGSVYLLNTDYDCTAPVTVEAEGGSRELTLTPLELTRVDLK